ncbi:MAG: NAD(P)-dependent glycerol-3-phosphate dehydrogenase [Gammaproteobacteria bacterium]|nr:NAD(P)-dependent glycerol-3-phosphate dehydrogenase [Gammaproteobacteria bacterium]MDH5692561.1 NAD(P)-dependent glycerol-3-phosphate dehydrogenase [Gammaproteobacteria bacterium]
MVAEGHRFAVLGAGSWGTALALLLARNGSQVKLWGRDPRKMDELQRARSNERYLPGSAFPDNLVATADLVDCLADADEVLLVVPSQGFRAAVQAVAQHASSDIRVCWASKGLEPDSVKLLHEVVGEELGPERPMAVLSGPTFAKEVAAGLPTLITVASTNQNYAEQLAERLHNDTFRAYTSDDMVGVQLGGAVKNVMAIAAGIADGMGLGANTRAALITRGLAEIQRLGVSLGGKPETFMGLAGLGDLVLTCTDNQSRNRRVGLALAAGKSLDECLKELGQVAEGVYAAQEVHQLAAKHDVEMPIVNEVYNIIYKNEAPHAALRALLARSQKAETD